MPKYTSPYQARIALSETEHMSVDQIVMIQDAINFIAEKKIIVGKVSSAIEPFLPGIKFKKGEIIHYISVSHFRTDYLSVFLQLVSILFIEKKGHKAMFHVSCLKYIIFPIFKFKINILGKRRYFMWLVWNMSFFHFSSSKKKFWPNGDIPFALSETCHFFNFQVQN